MVALLLYILILVIVLGVAIYVIRMLPLGEPFSTAAQLIILVIFLVLLLGIIGVIPGFHVGTLA